jgi:Family of unknown function (DUF6267)
MNLAESLSLLTTKIDQMSILSEDKGHLDHPEDLIFLGGSEGAQRALQAAMDTVKNPKTITIKWDGYPALIFGHGRDGKFSIMDKHMFNKKDGTGRQVFSPEQFVQYDQARGVDRSGLYQIISDIWPGLAQASNGSKGFYWGDLLFTQPLQEQNGVYSFKANPNGITYQVAVNSEIGQLLGGEQAGIAVHQYLDPSAISTDQATTLNGTIGKLKNNSNVAIVPSKMPITPKLSLDAGLVKNVQSAINKYGQAVDQLMDTAPQARNTFNQLFTVYVNKRIVAGNLNNMLDGFMQFVESRPMTDRMKTKILEHLQNNEQGLVGAFTIWVEMYKLKMAVVEQLNQAAKESPVKGFLDDGTETHEGFVANGLKFVDRMGFSRQNLAGR